MTPICLLPDRGHCCSFLLSNINLIYPSFYKFYENYIYLLLTAS